MTDPKDNIKIGLIGIGVIGSGVARAINEKTDMLSLSAGNKLEIVRIIETDKKKYGLLGIDKSIFSDDFNMIVSDPEIDLVVELIGGEKPAYEYIKRALLSGKHVVTANKEVVAKHGRELVQTAREHGVAFRYEASVGGGIPLIAPFQEDLIANDITAIHGIVNGTTNYILTKMAREGVDFNLALKQAQELGYAETNPTNDIEGNDAVYKISILSTLAFGINVDPRDVYREGISKLEAKDFRYAKEFGYAIKLLAIAKDINGSVEVRVHPVLLPDDYLLAKVDGVFNAVQIEGDLTGKLIFYGRGAGDKPTSSAVLADIISIARDMNHKNRMVPYIRENSQKTIISMPDVITRYYLRLNVADKAGVLAQISRILGDNSISISSVIQKEANPVNRTAEIVIMTHPAQEKAMQASLEEIKNLEIVNKINNLIRVEA